MQREKVFSRISLEAFSVVFKPAPTFTKSIKMHCLLLVLLAAGCLSAPVDDPVHVDLPVYDQPEPQEESHNSQALVSKPLEPENYSGYTNKDEVALGAVLDNKVKAVSNVLGSGHASSAFGVFAPPVTTREGVLLESEGIGSSVLSIKENAQSAVAGILQPKPIVDTIQEEDKYGNSGDKFYTAGRAIVNGAENLSNFINSALEVPSKIFQQFKNAATEKLNNFGGRLTGLY